MPEISDSFSVIVFFLSCWLRASLGILPDIKSMFCSLFSFNLLFFILQPSCCGGKVLGRGSILPSYSSASLFSGAVPWGSDLHRCFCRSLAFPFGPCSQLCSLAAAFPVYLLAALTFDGHVSLLGWDRKAAWGPAGRKALLAAQLRFWQILSSWRAVLCCGEDCCISQWLPFPPRARRTSFSSLHHENMVCFLEIKPADVPPPIPTCPLRWWPQEFLCLVLACTWASSNSSRLSFKHSYKSVAQWFLLQISIFGLWFSVFPCLSRCWGGGLTCDLNFLISSRKVIDFQLVQIFVLVDKYRMMTSKSCTCQSWNYIPLIKYSFLDWRSSWLSIDFF